jgi:hypothetical protein
MPEKLRHVMVRPQSRSSPRGAITTAFDRMHEGKSIRGVVTFRSGSSRLPIIR